ncbi:hypothetical protein FVE85_8923 [Porphyridium purpureum]|uniref:Reverse transcriptase domain-containing protein n=1 Tax=Porphyridium purpureum TaxID=35688 RepID=A0A5J4YFX7_PORPP|nr:hypothetical protein FVE85_8923 [Porphyridium purpureum]|eukprot:POR0068..scf276_29
MCVNRTKTQLVLPPGMHTAVVPAGLADLPRLAWDQAQLLGVPLDFTGSGESLVPITNASAQVLQLAEQVAKLSHPEEAFYLLRGSVGPKRLMHLARTMPPPVVTRIFAEFDRAWRSIVARALGVMAHEVGEPCKAEWRLPCSLGGLGLTAVADIAPFAFAAGSRAAARVVDNPPARVYPPSLAQWWRRFDGDAHAVAQWRLEPDEDVEALLDSQARGSRRFYRQWCSDWSHAPAPSDPDFHRRRSVSSPHALAWLGMPSATQLAGTHGSAPLSADAWRVLRAGCHYNGPVCGPTELALAAAARRKQASFQAAARTGDAAGVSFQAVILDTYGRREQCGAAFLETLVAAYMRHRGVSKMLASTALHRSLSLAVYRSVAAAVLLRHPGPTLPVASQHWLETGRRLFVGEVSRVWVRNVVQSRFEELWPLVRSTYSDPPALRVGDEIIASACGVQQGDPLGPLLFSLVLHTVLQDIGAPDVQHFWYLDDGLVVGTPAQLAGFLAAFEMCGSAKGLHINRAKTQLVLPAGVAASEAGPFPGLTDLPVVEWSSAQLLGAPLDASGTSESLVPLHALAAHVVALAERVARLPNPELAFHLLRGSVGPRRLAYLARVMPPGVMDALFRTFDRQWRVHVGWTLRVQPTRWCDGAGLRASGGFWCRWRPWHRGLNATPFAPFAFAASSRACPRPLTRRRGCAVLRQVGGAALR